jgi:drug/metabolite transporter (DMT)-like permease
MTRRTIAILALIVLMIVWGSTFVVTKAAAHDIPPLTLAALRFLVAAIVLIPIALSRGGLARLPKPVPWASLSLMAISGIAIFAVTFTYALVHGSASQGALIYAVVPACVALVAVLFLGEKLSRQRIAGIVLSIFGVALVTIGGERSAEAPHPVFGALWMFGAVITWSAYTVFAKRLAQADFVVTIAIVSTLGAVMLLPFSAAELWLTPWSNPSISAWTGVLFLGIVASALAYIVYGFALRELDASLVGVYTNLDPIVGVLTAVLFLGEELYDGQIAGGLIAFIGMWLASKPERADALAG